MIRFLKVLYTLTPKQKPNHLCRWKINDNSEIKSILANYDNCGDKICKNPVELLKHVDDVCNHKSIIKNNINNK